MSIVAGVDFGTLSVRVSLFASWPNEEAERTGGSLAGSVVDVGTDLGPPTPVVAKRFTVVGA